MALTKQQLLKAHSRQTKTVKVGEGDITITELSLAQRSQLLPAIKKDPVGAQELVVCMGCDVFDENDPKDIEAVKRLKSDVVADIADEILNLSGLGDESAEKN